MRHHPEHRTTCDVSDLINEIANFVTDNPMWMDNDESVRRLGMAYSILASISQPDMVTDEEYEFIMDIHTTLKERIS
jgi:hypothetical protein